MTDDFERAFGYVVNSEGGYTNDAEDPGNWTGGGKGKGVLKGTRYGISAMSYPDEDIANLTIQRAMALYKRDYWLASGADKLPWPLNYLLFDTVVNQGGGPRLWRENMQQALGVADDGIFGPNTTAAAAKAVADPERLLEVAGQYVARRIERYAERSNSRFRRGLYKRAVIVAMRSGT